jgi:hypothetical protein
VKDSFCEELELVLEKNTVLKFLLGGFNSEVRREDIFKPIFGNEPVWRRVRIFQP